MLNRIGCSCFAEWSRGRKPASTLFHTKVYVDRGESTQRTGNLDFTSKYDEQATKRILGVINETSVEELSKYNISRGRLQKIDKYRGTNGPFQSLEQLLEAGDFGIKIFEKFVSSIAEGSSRKVTDAESRISPKQMSDVSSPVLTNERREIIGTTTSIAFGPKHVSWAKVASNGRLLSWDSCYQFQWPRRDDPMQLHELALVIRERLPESDVYVTELPPATQLATIQQNVPGLFTEQRLQLSAMMAALLASEYDDAEDMEQRRLTSLRNFYFLRRNLSARLFKLIIGDEIVSARAVLNQIIEKDLPQSLEHIPPIIIDHPEIEMYDDSDVLKKEALGQALLCSATFVILAIQQSIPAFRTLRQIHFRNKNFR